MNQVGETINSTQNLRFLYRLSSALVASFDLQTTIERLLTLAGEYLQTSRGSLIVMDGKNPVDAGLMVDQKIYFNNLPQFMDVIQRGLAGWVLEHQVPVFIENTYEDVRWLKRIDDQPDQTGAKSVMAFPLEANGNITGVITMVSPEPNSFQQEQFEFLQIAAEQAAIALQQALQNSNLIASQWHYMELFQENLVPMLVTTQTGQIVEVNHAARTLLQLNQDEANKGSIFDFHQAPLDLLAEGLDALIDGEKASYEATFHGHQREPFFAMVSVRALSHHSKHNFLWVVNDIADAKELEQTRNDLTAMIYHDIRSPLANVISSLELLKLILPGHEDRTEDRNIEEVLSVISRSTNRVQRLVNNLLDINRLEDQNSFINLEEVDVRELIRDVISDVAPTFESRKQICKVEISDTVRDVWADEDMLNRVLINLLENAAKYSPMEDQVSVEIESLSSGAIRFLVEDNGIGIQQAKLEEIFEKFNHVRDHEGPKGIGLGLAYCRLSINAHGGRIWAESDGVKGSRFIFELPNRAPEASAS